MGEVPRVHEYLDTTELHYWLRAFLERISREVGGEVRQLAARGITVEREKPAKWGRQFLELKRKPWNCLPHFAAFLRCYAFVHTLSSGHTLDRQPLVFF